MKKIRHDLVTQFRITVMTLIYALIIISGTLQAIRGLIYDSSKLMPMSSILIVIVALASVVLLRLTRRIEFLSNIGLMLVLACGAYLDIFYGRHSFSPFILWTCFIAFAGFLVNRRGHGRQIAIGTAVTAMFISLSPLMLGFHEFSMDSTKEAFVGRVGLAILMVAAVPWTMTFLFERVLRKNRTDLDFFRSGMEKQRNKALLAHFANNIVDDLRGPLNELEAWMENFRTQADPQTIVAAKVCIEQMGLITDRYRQLSLPSQMTNERGMTLEGFLNAIQTFSPGSSWSIHGPLSTQMRLRGDHVVTLQLILCLGLMNAQSLREAPIRLEVERKADDLCFALMDSANSFSQEIQMLLQDMQGAIEHVGNNLQLRVPLDRLS